MYNSEKETISLSINCFDKAAATTTCNDPKRGKSKKKAAFIVYVFISICKININRIAISYYYIIMLFFFVFSVQSKSIRRPPTIINLRKI